MKTLAHGILSLTLVSALVISGCSPGTSPQPSQTYTVTTTDAKGSTVRLTGFIRDITSHSFASQVDPNEPTQVTTKVDYLDLWCIGPEMPFSVRVPFALIQEASFEPREADDWNLNLYLHATVTLGDGQVLQGATGGFFEGESSLGATSFRLDTNDFESAGARHISFEQTAQTSWQEPLWGEHTAILHKLDGTTVTIENAAFVAPLTNRNGCWIGDEPGEELDFEANGMALRVAWDKVDTIRPKDMTMRFDRPDRLILTAHDQSQTEGHCPPYIHQVQTVRGTMAFGQGYRLWVEVDLGRPAQPLFTKLELR